MVMTENEIYSKVQRVLVDSLGVDEADVTPEARLTEDLGAESIDYLDIAFQTERVFGIKIQPSDMLLGDIMTEPYVEDGRITDVGIEEFRRRLPHVNLEALEQSRNVRDLRSVFTVDTLVRLLTEKLAETAAG
ncbi:MAG: acyl carrier protein [Thermoguttaceae bacterium]